MLNSLFQDLLPHVHFYLHARIFEELQAEEVLAQSDPALWALTCRTTKHHLHARFAPAT